MDSLPKYRNPWFTSIIATKKNTEFEKYGYGFACFSFLIYSILHIFENKNRRRNVVVFTATMEVS